MGSESTTRKRKSKSYHWTITRNSDISSTVTSVSEIVAAGSRGTQEVFFVGLLELFRCEADAALGSKEQANQCYFVLIARVSIIQICSVCRFLFDEAPVRHLIRHEEDHEG